METRHNSRFIQFTMLALVFLAWLLSRSGQQCFASSQEDRPQIVSRVVDLGGWPIPQIQTGKVKHETKTQDLGGLSVTTESFPVSKPYGVPRFYMDNGTLVMRHILVSSQVVTRWSVSGKVYAYSAYVFGIGIATSGAVQWIDQSGNGKFDLFLWSQDDPRPPNWVSR